VLIEERVLARLAATTRFKEVVLLDVTDSTNRVALDRARQGQPEGLAVVADVQTAGRGRLDRVWEAEPGAALLVSVVLRPAGLPPNRWHLCTAAAGLAARQVCLEVAGFNPELKWPNDLLVADRKLAGILAEAEGEAVVEGMGLNVHGGPPGSAWVDDRAGRRVDRGALLAGWLVALDGWLGRWEEVAATYARVCATVGRQVRVDLAGGPLVGRAERIDPDGRLVVRTREGQAVPVAAGDVTHLGAAGAG
jgi:BirA family biotin operon repressor/biotin-[acetyl-CoA-carboxylase] ligase